MRWEDFEYGNAGLKASHTLSIADTALSEDAYWFRTHRCLSGYGPGTRVLGRAEF